jgi:hypothetical protein
MVARFGDKVAETAGALHEEEILTLSGRFTSLGPFLLSKSASLCLQNFSIKLF